MQVLIIEDERLTADALAAMITELRPEAEILARIGSVTGAVEWLETHPSPDLIFCDIHLSDGISFEIFREVPVSCPVIFCTAYDEYAIEAFQVNSIDYLLKPVDPKAVAGALRKYEERYPAAGRLDADALRALLQDTRPEPAAYKSRLMVKIGEALKPVAVDDIAYFQVEEGVTVLTTFEGRRYTVNYSLDQLEPQLDPARFFRANRQFIVHIEALAEVRPFFKGRLSLSLRPPVAERVIVSSGRAGEFKGWLEV